MTEAPFILRPGELSLEVLGRLERSDATIELAPECVAAIEAGRAMVSRAVEAADPVYGINTGLGTLSKRIVSPDDLEEMQSRVLLSNAAGTGPLLSDSVVRRMMLLKINTLISGRSGVSRALVDSLLALYNAGVCPCIPGKGSVGASGDLAPLAHLGVGLLGEGEMRVNGHTVSAADGLAQAGLKPMRLEAKEGLALVNGTQASTSLAVQGLFAADRVFAAALVAGALSVEATLGRDEPFDLRIQAMRYQVGQSKVAAALRALLAGSSIRDIAVAKGRLQDPYSLRCQPQVMGACLDFLHHAAGIIERELNAITDNPLVIAEEAQVLYGGNFHAEPVALASDAVALALSEVGSISERRIALLTDENHSMLPAFLATDSGIDSGFMVAQVTAAALASENRSLAHPASVDNIPTTGNHEDFVSMATYAARRLDEVTDNAAGIIAIELLIAAQGLELRRPARSSPILEEALSKIRECVPAYEHDRFLAPDISSVKRLVQSGEFLDSVPAAVRLSA